MALWKVMCHCLTWREYDWCNGCVCWQSICIVRTDYQPHLLSAINSTCTPINYTCTPISSLRQNACDYSEIWRATYDKFRQSIRKVGAIQRRGQNENPFENTGRCWSKAALMWSSTRSFACSLNWSAPFNTINVVQAWPKRVRLITSSRP